MYAKRRSTQNELIELTRTFTQALWKFTVNDEQLDANAVRISAKRKLIKADQLSYDLLVPLWNERGQIGLEWTETRQAFLDAWTVLKKAMRVARQSKRI